MIVTFIISLIIYIFFPIIFVNLLTYLKNRALKKMKMLDKNYKSKETLWKKIKKYINIGKENPKTRFVMYILYFVGMIINFGMIMEEYYLFSLFFVMIYPYLIVSYSFVINNKIITTRENFYKRLLSVKKIRMGLVGEEPEFVITEWEDDLVVPKKIELQVPATFDETFADLFLKQFNTAFGFNCAWIPDNIDDNSPGWDFTSGICRLRKTKPMPQSAAWCEHYLLNKNIAWSFFPIALGVENGVSLPTNEEGIYDNVLGFDVAGQQAKLCKKNNIECGEEILAAPMILVAGPTGSGKSISLDTEIPIYEE